MANCFNRRYGTTWCTKYTRPRESGRSRVADFTKGEIVSSSFGSRKNERVGERQEDGSPFLYCYIIQLYGPDFLPINSGDGNMFGEKSYRDRIFAIFYICISINYIIKINILYNKIFITNSYIIKIKQLLNSVMRE